MSVQSARRDGIPDLLSRPPNGTRESVTEWAHLQVDPVGQLDRLADLFAMCLLSESEYKRYTRHVRDL